MKKVRLFYYLINFILPYFEEEEEEFSSLLMFCSPTLESWCGPGPSLLFFFSALARCRILMLIWRRFCQPKGSARKPSASTKKENRMPNGECVYIKIILF